MKAYSVFVAERLAGAGFVGLSSSVIALMAAFCTIAQQGEMTKEQAADVAVKALQNTYREVM